jgi:hypothetical protein
MRNVEKEIWENPHKGNVFIKTYDHTGKLVSSCIRGGKKLAISIEERLLNQEMAASEKQDLFMNGMLRPVQLIESAEDYAEIANNPNLISDSEIKELFNLKAADFKARISSIDNEITMNRILEVAQEMDVRESQLKAVQAQVDAVSTGPKVVEHDSVVGDAVPAGSAIKAVSPR